MLIKNNKVYRNLQEQVLDNQEAIQYLLNEGGVLNQFGIRVVGKVENETQLPSVSTYDGEYGDAFAVGTTTPYDLYIWTRSFAGNAEPFWFNIGKFPVPSTIPGPEGPQGADGKDGERGSKWNSATKRPDKKATDIANDQALDTSTGDVYQYNGSSWVFIGNIRGPQGIQGIPGAPGAPGSDGPQGPQGEAGPAGRSIEIVGTLENTGQLPDPSTVERYYAYLIPDASGVEHIWLITGTTTLVWHDAGGFGGGIPASNVANVIYGTDNGGNQTQLKYTPGVTGNSIVQRQANGCITVPSAPQANTDAVSKKYVDDTEDTLQGQIDTVEQGLKKEISDLEAKIPAPAEVFGANKDGLVPGPTTVADNLYLNSKGEWKVVEASGGGSGADHYVWDMTDWVSGFSNSLKGRVSTLSSEVRLYTTQNPIPNIDEIYQNLKNDKESMITFPILNYIGYDIIGSITLKRSNTIPEPYVDDHPLYFSGEATSEFLNVNSSTTQIYSVSITDQTGLYQIVITKGTLGYVANDVNKNKTYITGNYNDSYNGPQYKQLLTTTEATGDAVVQRGANGDITVLEEPVSDTSAVSKKYVDNAVANAGGGGGASKHGLYKLQYIQAKTYYDNGKAPSDDLYQDFDEPVVLVLPFSDAVIDHKTFLDYYTSTYNTTYSAFSTSSTAWTTAYKKAMCWINPSVSISYSKIDASSGASLYQNLALCIASSVGNSSGGTNNLMCKTLYCGKQGSNVDYGYGDAVKNGYILKPELLDGDEGFTASSNIIRAVRI